MDSYSPPQVDRIWAYYNIPEAILYLLKRDDAIQQEISAKYSNSSSR